MTREIVTDRYAKLSITLHWLMLALFVGVYACIEIKGLLPRGSNARALFLGLHGLFGLMIVTPLMAWLMLAAGDKPLPYFDFYLSAPVSVDPDLAKRFKYWHEWLGSSGYWLIGLHAVAGLFHHYWVGDNTLARMLSGRSRS
jgi:cytochrome b561